jgi:hypothetical protein
MFVWSRLWGFFLLFTIEGVEMEAEAFQEAKEAETDEKVVTEQSLLDSEVQEAPPKRGFFMLGIQIAVVSGVLLSQVVQFV